MQDVSFLKEALNETEEVVLAYKQNVFTVLFASEQFSC